MKKTRVYDPGLYFADTIWIDGVIDREIPKQLHYIHAVNSGNAYHAIKGNLRKYTVEYQTEDPATGKKEIIKVQPYKDADIKCWPIKIEKKSNGGDQE